MLKPIVDSLEGVPEAAHEFYLEKDDGKLHLQVADMVPTERVKKVSAERDELKAEKTRLTENLEAFKDLDPKEAREAIEKLAEFGDNPPADEEKILAAVKKRLDPVKKDYEAKLANLTEVNTSLQAEKDKLSNELDLITIDQNITTAVAKVGQVKDGAMHDIMSRARLTWKRDEEGNFRAFDHEGTKLYGTDGISPITPEEWAKGLLETAPFLFERSEGGGSQNNNRPGASGGKVYTKQQWTNLVASAEPDERKKLINQLNSGAVTVKTD